MNTDGFHIVTAVFFLFFLTACSSAFKSGSLRRDPVGASLELAGETDFRELDVESVHGDTLKIVDNEGRELLIMKAVRDENGEMVASDVIDAAVVKAKFRNVAERGGKVDIAFQIRVPARLTDGKWQLRFSPMIRYGEVSRTLDRVFITGRQYRRAQLRGYQQYERFLASIITDSSLFVRKNELEIFLHRNIPLLYALKKDSTFVSDESFASIYGVTEQMAVKHYTNRMAMRANDRRIGRKDRVFARKVRVPIESERLRLDTVLVEGGEFVYEYVQTMSAAKDMRKVDLLLEGEIYEEDRKVFTVPCSEPLTFYISSLSTLVDETPRYLVKIIGRQVSDHSVCYIDFASGSSALDLSLSDNSIETERIKTNFAELLSNGELVMDSVIVTASCSPEGSYSFNTMLAGNRGKSVMNYFRKSIDEEYGQTYGEVPVWKTRSIPENWMMLERLVASDTVLTADQKTDFENTSGALLPDVREKRLSSRPYYRYLREKIYPRLRTVRFDFFLHRKDMVQDTLVTTVLDTLYQMGVDALKNREYEAALSILRPYSDFNTALALKAMDYNATALSVLEGLPSTAETEYLSALVCAAMDDQQAAVRHYVNACNLNSTFVHRGNLDPEISPLIKKYNLNFYQSK